MTLDPDELLARMPGDAESAWFDRLLDDLAAAPLVDEATLNDIVLSPAETRVVSALSHGLTYDEAAAALGIGQETVQTHLKVARRKLRAKNTVHLCAIALRRTIIN